VYVNISKSFLLFQILTAINKTHFKFHSVIGKGGFGKVWKIERKKFKTTYAMKEMAKCRIV
jgi:protein kinase A